MVFDRAGRVIAIARRGVEVIHPQADWVEQDPELLVSSVFDVIGEVTDLPPSSPPEWAGFDQTVILDEDESAYLSVLRIPGASYKHRR